MVVVKDLPRRVVPLSELPSHAYTSGMSVDPIGFVPEWTFADRLRKIRHMMAPCTQVQFAEMIGENPKAYSQWESGNNGPRNLVAVAQKISDVTGVSPAWLLGLAATVPTPPDGLQTGYKSGRTGHLASMEDYVTAA